MYVLVLLYFWISWFVGVRTFHQCLIHLIPNVIIIDNWSTLHSYVAYSISTWDEGISHHPYQSSSILIIFIHFLWFSTYPSAMDTLPTRRWGRRAWCATCSGRTQRMVNRAGTRWTRACRTPMAPMWWMTSWRRITWTPQNGRRTEGADMWKRKKKCLRPSQATISEHEEQWCSLVFLLQSWWTRIPWVRFDKMAEGPQFFEIILLWRCWMPTFFLQSDYISSRLHQEWVSHQRKQDCESICGASCRFFLCRISLSVAPKWWRRVMSCLLMARVCPFSVPLPS